jgi:hypothetical protein
MKLLRPFANACVSEVAGACDITAALAERFKLALHRAQTAKPAHPQVEAAAAERGI